MNRRSEIVLVLPQWSKFKAAHELLECPILRWLHLTYT
jgi:hypothetical protein